MAFTIRNLRIRDQLFLVSFPPLFVLICAVALFFYAYGVAAQTNRTTQKTEEAVARGESLLRRLAEMHMGASSYLFTRQNTHLTSYDAAFAGLSVDLTALRDLETENASHTEAVDALRGEISRWQSAWVLPNIEKVKRGESVDLQAAMSEGEAELNSIRAGVTKLLEEDRETDLMKRSHAEQVIRRMLFLELGITLLMGAALLFLGWTVTRIIADPVLQLIEASERVGHGDFQPHLPPASDNEFGVLSRSFARMTGVLRREREEMAALNKFSEAVTQCTTEREIYDQLLRSLRDRFQPVQAIIFALNSIENLLESVATLEPLPEKLRQWPVIEEPHLCKAVRLGRPFRVSDVTKEPLCSAKFAEPKEGSYYCSPLIAGGIIIGAVRLEGMKESFSPERETVIESYLGSAASALSNLRLLDTMKQQANIDILTALYNRRFLQDYARKAIAMARRKDQPLGFIMIDLDHFKAANDAFGHEAGDRILRQFAQTVTATMRETNLAARFGGEEFLVLLPDTSARAATLVAERIRKAVARMVVVPSSGDKPLPPVTVSLGVAIYPDHGGTLEEVLQAADKALYDSKRSGRNRTTLYVEQVEPAGS